MKLKYEPCKNCGASEYEINSLNTYKCEYCGTEYEIELPKESQVDQRLRWNGYPIMSTCIFSTVGMDKY